MAELKQYKGEAVEFVETVKVKDGVVCDVYKFLSTSEKDLGIVTVQAGFSTPLQKVLKGDRTIEELISGEGTLMVVNSKGNKRNYEQTSDNHEPVEIKIGELVQWTAKTDLVFSEICYPPYQEGRYQNLS